ncbi:glycosyltransferase family 4 protein [Ancylobacter sp. WKF20]|uniref:glycosyltransferase family 4 protein n=1 Tax=Ancylobacter sp. WKF20 TaxID=3039801 RepID=UPI0024345CFA|nr:glycosyltransferase family 4 protein [Ancylobacter sp. WKF20]WGD30032.1 glycosyltransferase family 4 protein [Ancylobacter sp. WKF20]
MTRGPAGPGASGAAPERLLLINHEYPPIGGGAGNATENLARELAGLGAEVRVITARYGGLPARETTAEGVEVIRIPALRRRRERSSILEMLSFMASSLVYVPLHAARWRPSATIAFFGLPAGPSAWLARWVSGAPYIVSLRGGDVPGFQYSGIGVYHRLTGPVIGFLWRRAAAVVANSEGLADLARRFAPDVAISLIPNGVDAGRFVPAPASAPGEAMRLVIVGRLVHQKGIDSLLTAMARAGVPLTLEIVGDGEARAELEAQPAALGIAGRVTFTGWLDRAHLPAVYAGADLFVFPSRDEGMPNVVLEAMAAGLPVIGSDIAGNRDLIVPEETGLLVPVDDPDALARALARLQGDPARRRRMGAAGRARVEAHFSWREAARRYCALVSGMRAANAARD